MRASAYESGGRVGDATDFAAVTRGGEIRKRETQCTNLRSGGTLEVVRFERRGSEVLE